MKKTLLMMLVAVVCFSATAQNESRKTQEQPVVKTTETKVTAESIHLDKAMTLRELRASIKQADAANVAPAKSADSKASYAPGDFLVATFTAKGVSYWSGDKADEWEMVIRKDETENNKFWISNMIGDGTANDVEVYGTLSGTVLSIPCGQYLATSSAGAYDGVLTVYNNGPVTSGNLVGDINESNGTIVFRTGMGAYLPDVNAWFNLFLDPVTCYHPTFLPPSTAYVPPLGLLWMGASVEGYSLWVNQAVLPAYTTWTFENKSTYADVFSWVYEDMSVDPPIPFNSTNADLSIDVETGMYLMPELTGTNNLSGLSTTYGIGTTDPSTNPDTGEVYDYAYVYAGGSFISNPETGSEFHLTNFDSDLGHLTVTSGNDNSFLYGTGSPTKTSDAIMVFYDVVEGHPIYFEGINLITRTLTVPSSGTIQFKLEIFEAELTVDPEYGDIYPVLASEPYATAILTRTQVVQSTTDNWGYMQFRNFTTKDEEGFDIPLDHMLMEKSFILKLTGYNATGVTLTITCEYGKRKDAKNQNRVFLDVNGTIETNGWGGSLPFQLWNAAYSYLHIEDVENNAIHFDNGSSSQTLRFLPLYNLIEVDPETVPDWITLNQQDNFSGSVYFSNITITAAENTNGASREGEIRWDTVGAYAKLKVTQGSTGIVDVKVIEVNAVRNGDNFTLTYPASTNSVAVYNVAGQKVAEYALNSTGRFTMPAADLKGVYILKFEGVNQAIKIMK